jgi:hypothetical protein
MTRWSTALRMNFPTRLFCRDYNDPTQRFIYVDGAPYDGGTNGKHMLRRAMKTPSVLAATITAAFSAAAATLTLPTPDALQFRATAEGLLPITAMSHFVYTFSARFQFPHLDDVVIDKTGQATAPISSIREVQRYLRSEIFEKSLAMAVSSMVAVTANAVMGDANSAAVVLGLGVSISLPKLGWALHAWRQLERERWSVTLSPRSRSVTAHLIL